MDAAEKNDSFARIDWRDALLILVLLAIVVYYFRQLVWTNTYIYGELDIRRSIYLFKKVSYDLLRSGEPPLWISHLYCGMPLLGAFLGTPFYPLDLILMLAGIPLNMVFNWDLLAHITVAQVFSFLFFKRVFQNRTAAAFCSMWFWNCFFLGSILIGDALNLRAMLLIPPVFYFIDGAMAGPQRPRNCLFGAMVIALQLLSGGLQFTFYTLVAVTAYALVLLFIRMHKNEHISGSLAGFLALIIVAFTVASAQLLPEWHYTRFSVRASGVPWFRIWAIEPYQLVDYLIPMFEGEGRGHGYFGIVTIVLACFSLLHWTDKRKHLLVTLCVVSIIYSLGDNTRISSLLGSLPVIRSFRGPFRGAIFFNFAAFFLAGGTMVGLSRSGRSRAGWGHRALACCIGMALLAGFVGASILAIKHSGDNIRTVVISGIFLLLSLFLVASMSLSGRRFGRVGPLMLVGLLFGDLALRYGNYYSPAAVADLFERDWTVEFLEGEISSSRIAVYNTAHSNYFGLFGIEAANGHHPFPVARFAEFLPLLKEPKIASLAGVKYQVVYSFQQNGRPHNPPVENRDAVTVELAALAPLPRAFLVRQYRVVRPGEVLDTMRLPSFDPHREVVLEEPPAELDTGADGQDLEGSVRVISRKANEVVLEVETENDAILVFCDSYHPGWSAEINGERRKVLVADYVFRAVPLSKGKHTVVFRFRPQIVACGLVISCLGLLSWCIWTIAVWRRGITRRGL